MSIASPTLRSSSSTVPGPNLSKSLISIRARPSTADTCTGTSNTASRSPATREVWPSASIAPGISGCDARSSRLAVAPCRRHSSVFLHDLTRNALTRAREVAACTDVARDRFADRAFGDAGVPIDAAVGPFDTAIADRNAGLSEHHQPAAKALGAGDIVDLFAHRRV